MLTRMIPAWVCGAVLCCAVPAAFCQSPSGSLAVDDASQSGSGAGSMGARSAVSADATMNAEAGGIVGAEAVSGAVDGALSGAGAGSAGHSAGQDFRIGEASDSGAANGRLEFGLERGLRGDHHLESKRKEVFRHPARTNAGSRTMRAEPRRSGRAWRAREDSAGNRVDSTRKSAAGTTTQAGASYSTDFPDSTRGTALLSPPASNRTPFDWAPSLNYELPNFAERRFLYPSLHAGHFARKRGREAASNKALPTGNLSGDGLTSPDFSTSMGDVLQTHVPDPLADLNSQ